MPNSPEPNEVQTRDDAIEIVESESLDAEGSLPEYHITTYPADYTLEVLHQKWNAGEIEIPAFQRQYVWKDTQASKLIESFLAGLPVPPIFLYTERRSQKQLVIDGQQRLKSVFFFFEGLLAEDSRGRRPVFKLKGLSEKSRWFGKAYVDLDPADQRKLKNAVLRAFIVQQLDPDDDTIVFHVFERLNTGGTLLANQEIRNCVYSGSLNKLLLELNLAPEWRALFARRPGADRRQRDVELILRFLALQNLKAYTKPMKDHLTTFMKRNRNSDAASLKQMEDLFLQTCRKVSEHLGKRPFHVRTGLNAAVFDSVMAAFSSNLEAIPNDVSTRYRALLSDEEFSKCTQSGTTDLETVRKRFEIAEKLLFAE